MQKIALTHSIKNPVVIEFNAIRYPKGVASVFNGESFGFKALEFSVHYRTCKQINEGIQLHDLDYFKWTIQKFERLGKNYERFLFSPDKGCGLDPAMYNEISTIRNSIERHTLLAELSTQKFIELYDRIMNKWDTSSTANEILFYKIINRRFVIIDGLHRLNILFHKYEKSNYDGFITDMRNVKRGYYYNRFKHHTKKAILSISNKVLKK